MMYKADRQRYRGFLALATLVVIAIIAILYFLQFSAFFNISAPPGSKGESWKKPWHDEHLILGPNKIIEAPKPPKLEMNESFTLKPAVSREGAKRGAMTLHFSENGEVKGSWRSGYSHEDRHYSYEATFAGNIDVNVMYSDDDGEDKSQLYFITKGSYAKSTYIESTGTRSTENGTVYVTGFIKPDKSASGLLTITTDRKWAADYEWQCGTGNFSYTADHPCCLDSFCSHYDAVCFADDHPDGCCLLQDMFKNRLPLGPGAADVRPPG